MFFKNIYKILFVLPGFLFSQTTKKDTTYIKDLDQKITFKIELNNNIESFKNKGIDNTYEIEPNHKIHTKFGFNYRFISFLITLPIESINEVIFNPLKGESDITALELNLFYHQWHHYLFYNKTKGFYLKNTTDFIEDWNKETDNYITFPNLVYQSFSGISSYVINPNFSLRALTNQTEKQQKSAGSFIPSLWYKYYTINNAEAITNSNSTQKSNNLEFVLQMGYSYTQILSKNSYIAAGTSVGGGYKYTVLSTRNNDIDILEHNHLTVLQGEAHIATGYDNQRFFTGVKLNAKWSEHVQRKSNNTLINNALTFRFFLGYRFDPPKKLEKYMTEKLMPKLGLKQN